MITLCGVTKSYRLESGKRQVVIDGADLVFPPGHNVALLGVNGAGKSTLLRLIAGTEAPDKGYVIRECRVSWPLGFTGGFNGSTSGRMNVSFIARAYGEDPAEVLEFVKKFSELGEYLDEPVKSYSSGMRARLAFAVSMAIDFDTYLVDEITAVGDARFSEKCSRAFHERRKRSNIIMVSHSLGTIREYCDMAVLVSQGKTYFFPGLEDGIRAYEDILRYGQ